MHIPFLDLRQKTLNEQDSLRGAFERVLRSPVHILGDECRAFEAELGKDIGLAADRVVGCNSGTDALILALKAMGAGPGSEVIAPAHTAVPTISAIRAVGATPRFADIDPETWVMSAKDALSLAGPKTKAIIAVHLYGNGVDLAGLEKVRELVIEDVAQAQGGSFGSTAFGAWGRAGAFSFYPTKNLGALGDGGAVCFRSAEDSAVVRKLRFYGQENRNFAELDGGINSRLDEMQAAFLRERLKTFRAELDSKDKLRSLYLKELSGLPLQAQKVTPGCTPAWHLFVVAFNTPELKERAHKALEAAGIGNLVHYPVPNHRQKAFAAFSDRALPATESLVGRILSLPLHSLLRDEHVRETAAVLRRALS